MIGPAPTAAMVRFGRVRFLPTAPDLFAVGLLVLLCTLLYGRGIESRELWASHEARATQHAVAAVESGRWLIPRLFDGTPDLQKPPGYYWMAAAFRWVPGISDPVAVRMPAAVSGLLLVLMLWGYLRSRGRPVAALSAGILLAAAFHWVGTARIARIDVPLALVVAAMMFLGRDARIHRAGWVGLLGATAVLLKGPIGIVLPMAALAVWWVVDRRPLRCVVRFSAIVTAVTAAGSAWWFVAAHIETDGEFTRSFFGRHYWNRAFGGDESLSAHPFWFYIPRLAADFLPGTPLLVWASARRSVRRDADGRFAIVWLLVIFVGLSCSRFKRADYLLPLYPAAAMIAAIAWEQWLLQRTERVRIRGQFAMVMIGVLMVPGWMAFDRLVTEPIERTRLQKDFAVAIRTIAPSAPIVFYQVESHLLAYHLRGSVHTLVEESDLTARAARSPVLFAVVRADSLEELARKFDFDVSARSADFTPEKPQRPLALVRIRSRP